jgi:hypothetical protein
MNIPNASFDWAVNLQGKAGTNRRRISFESMFLICSHKIWCPVAGASQEKIRKAKKPGKES